MGRVATTAGDELKLEHLRAADGAEFERRSAALRHPVHIHELADGFGPARWSIDHIRQVAGQCRLRASVNDNDGRWVLRRDGQSGSDWEELPVAALLDRLEAGNPRRLYAGSISMELLPPLMADAERAPFLDWVEDRGPVRIRFWLGRDNATQLHYDLFHTFLTPVVGRKEVWLFAPTRLEDFYPFEEANNRNVSRVTSPKSFDPDQFPAFVSKKPVRLTLSPGKALFIPMYWWHYVEAGNDINVAVSYHFARPTIESLKSPYLLHYAGGQAKLR